MIALVMTILSGLSSYVQSDWTTGGDYQLIALSMTNMMTILSGLSSPDT